MPGKEEGKKTEEGRWGGEGGGIRIRIETLERAIRRQQIWVLNIYELAALVAFFLSGEAPGWVRWGCWLCRSQEGHGEDGDSPQDKVTGPAPPRCPGLRQPRETRSRAEQMQVKRSRINEVP